MEKVLGVSITEPGAGSLLIQPELGDLEYARGVFPTPHGPVRISKKSGEKPLVLAPDSVKITIADK